MTTAIPNSASIRRSARSSLPVLSVLAGERI